MTNIDLLARTFLALSCSLAAMACVSDASEPVLFPTTSVSSSSSGQRGAAVVGTQAVFAAHEQRLAACRGGDVAACWAIELGAEPCGAPKPVTLPKLSGIAIAEREAAAWDQKVYFDGTHCYAATRDQPGVCGMKMACQEWPSIDACRAGRAQCDAGER